MWVSRRETDCLACCTCRPANKYNHDTYLLWIKGMVKYELEIVKQCQPTWSSPLCAGRPSGQEGRASALPSWPAAQEEFLRWKSSTSENRRQIIRFSSGHWCGSLTKDRMTAQKWRDKKLYMIRSQYLLCILMKNLTFHILCVFTYIRCRGTRQEDVNWFQVVEFLQSICNSEARKGTKTKINRRKVWNDSSMKLSPSRRTRA